jgi:P-type conjugative transfer protein TrbJ
MRIKSIVLILLLIPVNASAIMEVRDTTNLIQNIFHTLRTIHIESQTMTQIAQKAKSLGNEATMINNLVNQLKIAEQNVKNVAVLVNNGNYRSIQELNNMCYSVQRVGHSVDGIGQTFKQLFPDTYALYARERKIQELKAEQEHLIEKAASSAINVQAMALDDDENKKLSEDIENILRRSQTADGIKGSIQLQSQLIGILINENRKLTQIIATGERIRALESAERMSDAKRKREEHERFMKGWGETHTEKNVMKELP